MKIFWSCPISLHFFDLFQLLQLSAVSFKIQYFDNFCNFQTFYTNGKQPSCKEYRYLMIFWKQYFTCVVWQKLPLQNHQIMPVLAFPTKYFFSGGWGAKQIYFQKPKPLLKKQAQKKIFSQSWSYSQTLQGFSTGLTWLMVKQSLISSETDFINEILYTNCQRTKDLMQGKQDMLGK